MTTTRWTEEELDEKRALELLAKSAGLNEKERQSELNRLLIDAALFGNEALAFKALQAGANPSAVCGPARWMEEGWPALACAARGLGRKAPQGYEWAGRESLCEALIRAGARGDKAGPSNWGPLHHAAYGGASAKIINLLLESGASPEERAQGGQTALSLAAENGSEEAALALLAAGADRFSADDRGQTPAAWAEKEGASEAFERALARAEALEIDKAARRGKSPSPERALRKKAI